MKMRLIFLMSALSLLLFSCEKKDKAITLPPKGDGTLLQVNMGDEYQDQFFVSLENQSIVHASPNNSWDLAFQCGATDHTIFMNGGQGMCAFATGKSDFASVGLLDTAQANHNWQYDASTGEVDSAVLNVWNKFPQVFIVKLNKSDTKYKKIKIISVDEFQYIIQAGELTATVPTTYTLVKKPNKNYTYFSLRYMVELDNIEPDKTTYDLRFCTYNYSFYDQNPVLRYVVVGCLINPNNTAVYKDSVSQFENITRDVALQYNYSSHLDGVGYDWKKYDFNTALYTVDSRYNFVIRTQNNRYFKLRFIDFYNPTGEKGSPKFEFVEL